MRYKYGINDHLNESSRTVTAKQLASIIKRDVEVGKWNNYDGGRTDKSNAAIVSYTTPSYSYHEKLYIFGKEKEFQELETLLQGIIPVIPRVFIDQ